MKYILNLILAIIMMTIPGVSLAASGNFMYIPGIKLNFARTGFMDIGLERLADDYMVVLPPKLRENEKTTARAHSAVRVAIIKQLLHKNLLKFHASPYKVYPNFAITVKSGAVITSDIMASDDLDTLIDNKMRLLVNKKGKRLSPSSLVISKAEIEQLGILYLRKNSNELKTLGYEVVSSRYRINYDPAYRRHNIVTAFGYLGHIRVLNPGESFDYLGSIHYDPKAGKNYKNGLAIVNDDEIPVYGGGICGGSTATYQGLVTNLGLTLKARNHSKRFSSLYTATINGQKITTPGIDATVFAGAVDLKVTNTSDHPIIIVLNFNGNYGGIEETMSLGLAQDHGSLEFVSQKTSIQKKYKKDLKTGSGYTETVKTGCYTWKINGVNKKSCYGEVW